MTSMMNEVICDDHIHRNYCMVQVNQTIETFDFIIDANIKCEYKERMTTENKKTLEHLSK